MSSKNIPETRLNSWYDRLHSGEWKTIAGRIAKYLFDANCGKTYNELSEALGIKHSSLTQPLQQMYKDRMVVRNRKQCSISKRECIAYNLHPILLACKKKTFSRN